MPDSVISVEAVSKRFFLRTEKAGDLRERFGALNPWRQRDPAEAARRDFWALKDVSFSVQPGQPVGIVGHNGSGKSTMLKLLTKIMEPTHGKVKVKGRIGALIEVGAGFHPDLSGRENVYLSGSILGLSRREIDSKFDRIVSFAGLERFIDTPVKRYSSGMYMRLGFSVAAHTDPDVLLIDEVLAVGDTLFQRKCIRHLQEFVKQGGTVVFVSHAMPQVAELCKTCVWLDQGQVRFVGETNEAIDHYMSLVQEREYDELKRDQPEEWELLEAERRLREEEERLQQEEAARLMREEEEAERKRQELRLSDFNRTRILGVTVLDAKGRHRTNFHVGEAFEVRIRYQFMEPPVEPIVNIEFWREEDDLYGFGTSNYDHRQSFAGLPLRGEAALAIDFLSLTAGTYRLRARLFSSTEGEEWMLHAEDVIESAARITVDAGNFGHGNVYLPTRWRIIEPDETVGAAAAREKAENSIRSRNGATTLASPEFERAATEVTTATAAVGGTAVSSTRNPLSGEQNR